MANPVKNPGADQEATALRRHLEGRRKRLAERRRMPFGHFADTFPACPSPTEAAELDARRLDFLLKCIEDPCLGPHPTRQKKAPLALRALKVARNRVHQGLRDRRDRADRGRFRRLMPSAASQPEFSVVMPTYNRRDVLLRTLRAYEDQESELCFEIVVIDDGGTDGTAEAVADLAPTRYGLKLLRQDNAGPAAARNRGLAAARASLVLITGDDIEPAPDLLLRHWQAHRQAEDDAVAILGLTRWPDDLPQSATMTHIDGIGAQQFNYGWLQAGRAYDFRHFYTSNISLHKERLIEVGGFDERFPAAAFEDAEAAYRMALGGLRIIYRPDAVGRHHHPYDAAGFFRRQVRCGAMAAVLYGLHPELAPLLGFHDLEGLALRWLRLDSSRRESIHRDFEVRSQALHRRAAGLDAAPPSGAVDAFLSTYFRWAYLTGLADGLQAFPSDCLGLLAHELGSLSP